MKIEIGVLIWRTEFVIPGETDSNINTKIQPIVEPKPGIQSSLLNFFLETLKWAKFAKNLVLSYENVVIVLTFLFGPTDIRRKGR